MSKKDDIQLKKLIIQKNKLEDQIKKERKTAGTLAKQRSGGSLALSAKEMQTQFSQQHYGTKQHHQPERRGHYIYRVLDTVLDDVRIVARMDVRNQQTVYLKVPRVKFTELIRHGLFQRGVEYSVLQG